MDKGKRRRRWWFPCHLVLLLVIKCFHRCRMEFYSAILEYQVDSSLLLFPNWII
jgi:hypothetical protein